MASPTHGGPASYSRFLRSRQLGLRLICRCLRRRRRCLGPRRLPRRTSSLHSSRGIDAISGGDDLVGDLIALIERGVVERTTAGGRAYCT